MPLHHGCAALAGVALLALARAEAAAAPRQDEATGVVLAAQAQLSGRTGPVRIDATDDFLRVNLSRTRPVVAAVPEAQGPEAAVAGAVVDTAAADATASASTVASSPPTRSPLQPPGLPPPPPAEPPPPPPAEPPPPPRVVSPAVKLASDEAWPTPTVGTAGAAARPLARLADEDEAHSGGNGTGHHFVANVPPAPLWQTVATVIVVGSSFLLVCCLWCFCCCTICINVSAEDNFGGALGEIRMVPPLSSSDDHDLVPMDEEQGPAGSPRSEAVARGVLAEALFGMFLPALGFALVLLIWRITGHRQSPPWLTATFLPFVYRNKVAEASLIRNLNRHEALLRQRATGEIARQISQDVGVFDLVLLDLAPLWECRVPRLRSLLGGLDVLDGATDGMSAGAAFLLDPRVHPRFVASFRAGAVSVLAPIVAVLHLWGIMSIVLLVSSTAQLALSLQEPSYAAELAGLGLLAERLEPKGGRGTVVAHTARGTLWLLAKVLSEQVPQLWLQTSLMMALEEGPLGQPIVLISVVVSLLSITRKSLETLCAGCSVLRVTGLRAIIRIPVSLVAFVVPLCAIVFVAFIALRLVMIQVCEDHIWGLTTGCISLDSGS
mmetsp:Transcript_111856/g.311314  ORF Transcript_111856/g.311314 Transcript_111856/m.311314 type:complete len:608 (-) Transcript_111856:135-1958(-)